VISLSTCTKTRSKHGVCGFGVEFGLLRGSLRHSTRCRALSSYSERLWRNTSKGTRGRRRVCQRVSKIVAVQGMWTRFSRFRNLPQPALPVLGRNCGLVLQESSLFLTHAEQGSKLTGRRPEKSNLASAEGERLQVSSANRHVYRRRDSRVAANGFLSGWLAAGAPEDNFDTSSTDHEEVSSLNNSQRSEHPSWGRVRSAISSAPSRSQHSRFSAGRTRR
jgi:hypothetical protein